MRLVKVKERLPEPGKKVRVWARNKDNGNTGSLNNCFIRVNDCIELEWRYIPSEWTRDNHCSYFDYHGRGQWIPEEWEDEDE